MSNTDSLKHFDGQIESLLEEIAVEEGLHDFKIEKAPGSIRGDGYLGVITVIQITGKHDSGKKKTLNLVVKSASKSDALRQEAPVSLIFDREIYMYNVVIPAFRKFQAEKGLPEFSSSAKCYKACIIDKGEALVMENLKELGYSVWERRLPMEHEQVKFVMNEYGRFHALSYALREQNPEEFEKLTNSMEDVFDKFFQMADFTKMFVQQTRTAMKSLDPETNKEAIAKFQAFSSEIPPFLRSLHKFVDKHSVIIHGDCWTNNMMFKYEDPTNPNKPTKMCLIDLQISRVASPVLDLTYYFYSCSSKKVISNWEYYLNVYYDSLSTYLKKLGTDPSDVYPYSVFREHWRKFAKYGLIYALILIHIMLSEQNEVTDLTEVAESGKSVTEAFDYSISNMAEYNDRIRHIILHFVDNNLI